MHLKPWYCIELEPPCLQYKESNMADFEFDNPTFDHDDVDDDGVPLLDPNDEVEVETPAWADSTPLVKDDRKRT